MTAYLHQSVEDQSRHTFLLVVLLKQDLHHRVPARPDKITLVQKKKRFYRKSQFLVVGILNQLKTLKT